MIDSSSRYSFNKYLQSNHYVAGTVLVAGDVIMSTVHLDSATRELTSGEAMLIKDPLKVNIQVVSVIKETGKAG